MQREVVTPQELAAWYDAQAEASGWFAPEAAFGLTYAYTEPGQSILDIGIGTGLGSVLFRKAGLEVHGMDLSEEMLAACRSKGFTNLKRHDLGVTPYPYDAESMDLVVCVGVLNFFRDLSPVFAETARILRPGGIFTCVVSDGPENQITEYEVSTEHAVLEETITMYGHGAEKMQAWIDAQGMEVLRTLGFTVFMDNERRSPVPARLYVVKKPDESDAARQA